jgi:glycosyltransferase involved in cell wall biosynthesis
LGALRDYDAALVPGYKGMEYAQRMGFPEERIFSGLYSCDTELFRPVGLQRHSPENSHVPWPKVFLYVGQLIERKGIATLVAAYQHYRRECSTPWELWCAGVGPLRNLLDGQPGIRILDFLQPEECAQVMGQCGAFILPSKWDHWGVVLHEAACAGMPILTSRNCFGHIEMVQSACNGYTFSPDDTASLAHCMCICANEKLARTMGENSLRLSYRFDSKLFARLILEDIPRSLRK